MAESPVLQSFSTLQNSSIIASLNANNTLITTAFADCLSLSGTQPNQMLSNLDMNNNQIINLPAPGSVNSPVRLIDFENAIFGTAGSGIFGLLTGTNTWTGTNTFSQPLTVTNTTQSTSTTTGAVVIDGGLGIAKNIFIGGTLNVGTVAGTGITTITINNLGSTFPVAGDEGIILQNTTASTVGTTSQISPVLRFSGTGWNTSSSASQEVDWIISTTPQSGGEVFGKLSFACQVAGGGYRNVGNFYSAAGIDAIQLGSGLRQTAISVAGVATGTGAGSYLAVQAPQGTTIFSFGTYSAIFGGSANLNGSIFSVSPITTYINGSVASTAINAPSTSSTSTTTGSFVVTGGIGASSASTLGVSVTSPIHYGGTAAGSSLTLASTSNGSPSGDSIQFNIGGNNRLDYGVTNGNNWTFTTGSNLFIAGITTFSANSASTSTTTGTVRLQGGIGITGAVFAGTTGSFPSGTIVTPVAISALPGSPVAGQRAVVNNAVTSPTFLGTVSTTGGVTAPVMYNGSAWVYC